MDVPWLPIAMGVVVVVIDAAALAFFARRTSAWSVRPSFGQALVTVVLCIALAAVVGWFLDPRRPDLAPIAVVVRTSLIAAIVVLGNVRIVQFMLRTTYGHAWYLWLMAALIAAALGMGCLRVSRTLQPPTEPEAQARTSANQRRAT
jgi:hypothetical protein